MKTFYGKTVALIIPPSPFLLDERVFVSLGILRVASALEQVGVKIDMLDLSGVENYLEAIEAYINTNNPDWFGLTSTTPQLPSAVKIAAVLKRLSPDTKVVLGGPHVTLSYSAQKIEAKSQSYEGRATIAVKVLESYFDILIAGDGEYAALKVFDKDCPKVVDGDDNRGPYFLTNASYEALPQPARHLVDMGSYRYSIDEFPATSLIAQLGCPFHCGFCGGRNSKSLRLVRTRSTTSIIQEMRWLYEEYGYTGFMFYDDELNISKSFVDLMNSIVNLQAELGVEFRLRGFIKAELFTEKQASAMFRAGFRWLLCGFESANETILSNIEKIATLEDNTRAVQIAKKNGLKIKALMSVGHPGENENSILQIRDWLVQMEIDDFDCTIITTYPGTPYYDLAIKDPDYENVWTYTHKKSGDRLHAYALDFTITPDYYKGDPAGGYKSYVFTDYLSAEGIVMLRDTVEREVRSKLEIPFHNSKAAIRFEHSMGQGLNAQILRNSTEAREKVGIKE